jgi:predicted dehydrogenase
MDYTQSYSSSAERGGGVLRDLSHELDLILWIFSDWKKTTALGGKISSLKTTSEDIVSFLLETSGCPVVHAELNYTDHNPRRFIRLNGEKSSFWADLVKNKLETENTKETQELKTNFTYQKMHEKILAQDTQGLCTFNEGMKVLDLIEALESALAKKEWITNNQVK